MKKSTEKSVIGVIAKRSEDGLCFQIRMINSVSDSLLGGELGAFRLQDFDPSNLDSFYLRIGKAVVIASLLIDNSIELPDVIGRELDETIALAEHALRSRAASNMDAQLSLAMHLTAEARRKTQLALLQEAEVLLNNLLDKNHAPAVEWANGIWPRLRQETIRIIRDRNER